jgi:hypothetical protein
MIKINFLDHTTLDKLYLVIFPNGNLVIPEGDNFTSLGSLLKIEDINRVINQSIFETTKHLRHLKIWAKGR